jgi:hypothetical protein
LSPKSFQIYWHITYVSRILLAFLLPCQCKLFCVICGVRGFQKMGDFMKKAFLARCAGVLIFAAISAVGARVQAQAVGGLTGVVSDSSAAVVADVEVKLENPETGFSATTHTSSLGVYKFVLVPPGTNYRLTFAKASFRALTLSQVPLAAGATETRNVVLELGDVSQSVTVSAEEGVTLNTTDASISNELDLKSVQSLPSVFRNNAALLMTLSAGVIGRSNGDASQDGSITGARADQATLTLDGMDVNDEAAGFGIATSISIPVDAIDEVRTTVGSADASFGRSASGTGAFITKSGTNNWHGSANEFHRDAVFAANDFFNNKNGLPRPGLIRNQFGASLGGPVLKDKLFFFVNYVGLRAVAPTQTNQIVPLDNVRALVDPANAAGNLAYINSTQDGNANNQCLSASRPASCISKASFSALQSLDPQGLGPSTALLQYINGRYPRSNNLAVGDGLNTGGFIFNSPTHFNQNTVVARLDYKLSSKQRLFARGTYDHFNDDQVTQQFPGDPAPQVAFLGRSNTWVVGDTWTISSSLTNQVNFGITKQDDSFPAKFVPSAPNQLGFSFGALASPYASISSQARSVPIPELRDDIIKSWRNHVFQLGTNLKFIRSNSQLTRAINFPSIGIGGTITSLDPSVRPNDISADTSVAGQWDSLFPIALGRFASVFTLYDYDRSGNVLPLFHSRNRDFRYNEYEFYGQDSWKLRSDLTLTYGLRWQIHSVPYEVNGFQATPTASAGTVLAARVAAAAAGASGFNAAPITGFVLGGPANNAPGFYNNDLKDLAPRVSLAYSPSFHEGLLKDIFGDRKTSIRAGGGVFYDRLLNTLTFELDQNTFLFDTQQQVNFGATQCGTVCGQASLASDPRFQTPTNLPVASTPATLPRPSIPNLDSSGNPVGFFNGGFPAFFSFDRNLKTPRNYTFSLGIQRELPGNFVLEVNYFGRLGRDLLAIGDVAQTLNFKDQQSGQFLFDAFGQVQKQRQQGVRRANLTPQPWFENQMTAALAKQGLTCTSFAPVTVIPNCTALAVAISPSAVLNGDVSTLLVNLAAGFGAVLPNVGLYAQTGADGYMGNFSSSTYHGLLVSLHKRVSNNLQFDFHYTFSHSVDNTSDVQNSANQFTFSGQNLVCSLVNLRLCRGDSNFDTRHLFTSNYVYSLPIGKGQKVLGNSPRWVDAVVGGWSTSGIVTAYSGFPFTVHTGTFPIDFTQDAPAVFVGPASNLKAGIHTDPSGNIQYFANSDNATAAFAFPFGGGTGNRNVVRGPHFINFDMGLLKNFKMPWRESHTLQLRLEAFNAFNHVNYNPPSSASLASPAQFGIISGDFGPRTMQVGLSYDF